MKGLDAMPTTPKPSRSAATPGHGLDRRSFLKYVGAGVAATLTTPSLGPLAQDDPSLTPHASTKARITDWVLPDGTAHWHPPKYPILLPRDPYPRAKDHQRLAEYEVIDQLVLPEGFNYRVVAQRGDTFGPTDEPGRQFHFGDCCDYTGLVRIGDGKNGDGKNGDSEEYWLFVNHEYVSLRPWLDGFREAYGEEPPQWVLAANEKRGILSVDGEAFPAHRIDWAEADTRLSKKARTTIREFSERILSEVGISVLRVRRHPDGTFEVVADAKDHRRIAAHRRWNVDDTPFLFTGPAATLLAGSPPLGTMSNCSGATTPWGTFLTCEENFQDYAHEDVEPDGQLHTGKVFFGAKNTRINGKYIFSNPTPPSLFGFGNVLDKPLDGRHYGWVSEIEPETGRLRKHTALGRFRHENVALRCEAGKRLAAYMGDDRRGGHVWKFVSDGVVEDPEDRSNQELLASGTLYVARFHEDWTGEWVPLATSTKLRNPEPQNCVNGFLQVPKVGEAGTVEVHGDEGSEIPEDGLTPDAWRESVEQSTQKAFGECTLRDLVDKDLKDGDATGVLMMDAFAMANACGGTPTARPEDIEVHPVDGTVYIAFTDATGGSDGSPDQRIFPDSRKANSRQYGAIYRIREGAGADEPDPAATDFTWGKFVSSGEVAESGGGFACADNMVFDPQGNLWMMTDISTSSLNLRTTRTKQDGTTPGEKAFRGVFGNNALFMIPTTGLNAGIPQLFAIAPMEAEFCGPTFTEDGRTLILSVQHPGEYSGARKDSASTVQEHRIYDRDNEPFQQVRTVPKGSNFPHGEDGRAPRSCVVCITRES